MVKELSGIITRAAEVRDATLSAENTAERGGGVLCDLLEYLAGMIAAGDMQVVADAEGTGLKVTFRNAQGQAVARRLNLPEVTAALSGLLSPALLAKLNAAYTKSGTNQTAIETRRLEIAELTERLKGRSQYSNAFTDPQICK